MVERSRHSTKVQCLHDHIFTADHGRKHRIVVPINLPGQKQYVDRPLYSAHMHICLLHSTLRSTDLDRSDPF